MCFVIEIVIPIQGYTSRIREDVEDIAWSSLQYAADRDDLSAAARDLWPEICCQPYRKNGTRPGIRYCTTHAIADIGHSLLAIRDSRGVKSHAR